MTEKTCGDDDKLPHWSIEEEHRLLDLLGAGTSLEKTAQLLSRSSDAIVKKAKRLGMQMPDGSKRKTTKGAFQALSWVRMVLSDAKNMADVKKALAEIDGALERIKGDAAANFQRNLQDRS